MEKLSSIDYEMSRDEHKVITGEVGCVCGGGLIESGGQRRRWFFDIILRSALNACTSTG